jgi:hypothetical protein
MHELAATHSATVGQAVTLVDECFAGIRCATRAVVSIELNVQKERSARLSVLR